MFKAGTYRRMAIALALVVGGAASVSAATQTFVFTGTTNFANEAVANAFGYEANETGVFNFTMRIDDSVAPSTLYYPFGGRTTTRYGLESFTWKVGEIEWSRLVDSADEYLDINDYTTDVGNSDGVSIYTRQKGLGDGFIVYRARIIVRDSTYSNYNLRDLSVFDLLDNFTYQFSSISTNYGIVELDNISLAISQTGDGSDVGALPVPTVPEPATWLLMITGFGLASITARRRLAHV